jgi:acylglycerol lipase
MIHISSEDSAIDLNTDKEEENNSALGTGNSLIGIGHHTKTRIDKKYHYTKRIETHLPNLFNNSKKNNTCNENSHAQHVGFFRTYDDEELYYQIFLPEETEQPRAIILVAHGFGENVESFEYLGRHFSKSGYCVITYDQRGFGRSSGKRGHMKSIEQWLVDGITVLQKSKQLLDGKIDGLRIFLYGHSTGSLGMLLLSLEVSKIREKGTFDREAFLTMMKHLKNKKHKDEEKLLQLLEEDLIQISPSITGCIATAPYLKVGSVASEWEKKVVHLISKVSATYSVGVSIEPDKFTSDPAVQKELSKDPLRVSDMTVKQLSEWGRVAKILQNVDFASHLNCSLLMLHGTSDHVSSCLASKNFYGTLRMKDKQIFFCKDMLHGLHLETKRDVVFSTIINWINTRLPENRQSVADVSDIDLYNLTSEHEETEEGGTISSYSSSNSLI